MRALDATVVREVTRKNGVSEVVARFLVARGHAPGDATTKHLDASLHALHDPATMPGVEAAAERIARAIERDETILVHGDYDVDGVTGTVLLMRLFSLIGARAQWHIPHRLTDGYSFGPHSIAKALETGAKLVISVDNGTSARETIAALREHGIDTIVTDHHEPPLGELPPAVAIVNAKLAGSTYPFRELCGAGVAFKLAWGVAQRISGARKVREDLRVFLADAMAYVAIATVCDVVPLVDENRVLARRGLVALEGTRNLGLRALLEACGLSNDRLVAEDVGYKIGPRLNAAGRLASAAVAVDMLLATDAERARALAGELDSLNDERRRIEAEITAQALEQARRFEDPAKHPVLVLSGDGWHPGVVGIVASRVVNRYHRPALVIGIEDGRGRGSARSVDEFDVLESMHGARELFVRYGRSRAGRGLRDRPRAHRRHARVGVREGPRDARRTRKERARAVDRRAPAARARRPRADDPDRPPRALRRAKREARPVLHRRTPRRTRAARRRRPHARDAARPPRRTRAQGDGLRHGLTRRRTHPRRPAAPRLPPRAGTPSAANATSNSSYTTSRVGAPPEMG